MLSGVEFVSGFGVMLFDTNSNSLSALAVPQRLRARIAGSSRVFNYGTRPFGALLGGVLAGAIGIRETLFVAAVGAVLSVIWLLAVADRGHPRDGSGARAVTRAEILRNVPLRALVVAEVISTTGSQMTWLALPWFVLVTTGSPTRMTFVLAAEVIGLGVAGLPSGNLLQRLGARRTMMCADALRAPLMLLVPVLHWTGHLSYARCSSSRSCSARSALRTSQPSA